MSPNTAVVVTVFNEENTVADLVRSLRTQSLLPAEAVIVDGGSSDDTWKVLQDLAHSWIKLRVYRVAGNRSVGRNYGVSKTSSPIFAFTDAGCLPERDWLEKLTQPFSDSKVNVVSGYYKGEARTPFQQALIPYVLVMPDKARKGEFYPATRSMALRRSVWKRSGGFDISLAHNEDYAFAHKLKALGYDFYFKKEAVVVWIPRQNLGQATWMFLRFAVGDIQAGIIRPQVKKLFIRYLIFAYMISLSFYWPFLRPALLVMTIVYLIWSIVKNFRYVHGIKPLFWLPVLQITADFSIIFGSVLGFLSRGFK